MARTRVLIVDDEEPMRSALIAVLEHSEIEGEGVGSAEKAILRLAEPPSIDLLLVDKNLPGKSGVDLIRWIRTSDQSLPIVMMTGYPSPESVKDTLNLGIDDYLEKPFPDIFSVAEVVRRSLQNRRNELQPLRSELESPPKAGDLPDGGQGGALVAAKPDEGGRSLAAPFEAAGTRIFFTGPREELLASIVRCDPDFVVLNAADFHTDLAQVIERIRKAAPAASCIVVSAAELDLQVLRTLLHLGVKGLFEPDGYAQRVGDLLARRIA